MPRVHPVQQQVKTPATIPCPLLPLPVSEVDGPATVPGGCRIRRKITRAYLGLSQARAINAHCAVTVKNEVAVQGAEQGVGQGDRHGDGRGGSSCPQVIPMLGNCEMICKRCANEIEFRLPLAGPSSLPLFSHPHPLLLP